MFEGAGYPRPFKMIGKIMFPEITVTELGEKLRSDEKFILLDVRELSELNQAKVTDSRLEVLPMSRLAREGVKALSASAQSQEVPVFVLCHHGNRSAQVTMWLVQQGYKNVFNVTGGINAYARKVDSSVGFY
jgi:rhodanese-related sulfurtransferase